MFFFVLHLKPSDLQYLNIFGQIRQTRQNSNHLRISNKFTANHIPALFPATDVSYSFESRLCVKVDVVTMFSYNCILS